MLETPKALSTHLFLNDNNSIDSKNLTDNTMDNQQETKNI
jgi:hypothetical protein